MRNLERFRQSSILSKKPSALFPPKPSIMKAKHVEYQPEDLIQTKCSEVHTK